MRQKTHFIACDRVKSMPKKSQIIENNLQISSDKLERFSINLVHTRTN
jgi:hypothetical protein